MNYYMLPLITFFWQGLAAASVKAPTPNALEQFFPFIILGLVFYFLLIRPQQRKYKKHTQFLSQIKRGDQVLTSSGIYGTIEGITSSFIILEVSKDVSIRVTKSNISSYINDITDNSKNKKQKLVKK